MIDDTGKSPVLAAEDHSGGWRKVLQIAALVLVAPAVAVGLFAVYTTLFPVPCGDFSGATALGVIVAWVIDLPVGLLALGSAMFVKGGSARMRSVSFAAACITLALPIIATVAFQNTRCR
jgi:hypothetical protein